MVSWLLGKLGKSGKVPYFGQFYSKRVKNSHTACWLALLSIFGIKIAVTQVFA
jgi:hypothetical protein